MAEDRHAKLRERILEIATTIIRTEGLGAVQARRVAKTADCSVGTLYNVYGNLDRLIIAANSITLDQLEKKLHEVAGSITEASLEQSLGSMATAYVDFARDERNAWRALFEHRLTTETSVPTAYREKQSQVFGVVESVLSSGVAGAEDLAQTSRAIFGAVHGIVSLAMDEKLNEYDDARTRAQVLMIVGAIARGLGRRPPPANTAFSGHGQ